MPFKSRAQQGFLEMHKPEVAKEFEEKTPKSDYKNLPEHVAKDRNGLKKYSEKYRRKKDGKEKI